MSGVAEALTIVQTIHKLYRNGYVVARNAPTSVRAAVDDLELLCRILFELKTLIDRHGENKFQQNYHGILAECLHRCNQAANEFGGLLRKFRAFNTSGSLKIGLRLQYVTIQDEFAEFQKRISGLLKYLHLAIDLYRFSSNEGPVPSGEHPPVPKTFPCSPPGTPPEFPEPPPQMREAEVDIKTFVDANREGLVIPDQTFQPDPHRIMDNKYLDSNGHSTFQAEAEKLGKDTTPEQWVYYSSWWLLKAEQIDKSFHDVENSPHSAKSIARRNTYLLKSSWIVEEAVISKGKPWSRVVRKFIQDLNRVLNNDLENFLDASPPTATARPDGTHELLEQATAILEWERSENNLKNDIISAERWFAVDLADCGLVQRERALYRTFVDARFQQGNNPGIMSVSSPYLLILWASRGESEMFASICDHHGHVNLCTQLAFEDNDGLHDRHDQITSIVSLNFSSIQATIRFSTAADCQRFLSIPRKFVAAMETRIARTDEVTILDTVLDNVIFSPSFKNSIATIGTTRKINGSSCSLRIYGSTPKERWETTRRLVLGSWAGDPEPWCYSFWLPLSRVQVRQDGCKITLQWAGFRKREKDGKGNSRYVYDPDNPAESNNSIEMTLGSETEASSLAACIFQLTETEGYIGKKHTIKLSEKNCDDICVYDIYDEGDNNDPYHAVVHCKTLPSSYRVSYIYFLYKSLNFTIATSIHGQELKLISLRVPQYLSKEKQPEFDGKLDQNARADLSVCIQSDELLHGLLEALTGWKLLYHRQVSEWTRKKLMWTSRRHHQVWVHVWQRQGGPEVQNRMEKRLTARLGEGEVNSYYGWYCALLTGNEEKHMSSTAHSVSLKLDIQNGDYLRTDQMNAFTAQVVTTKTGETTTGSVPAETAQWDLEVTCETDSDATEFYNALGPGVERERSMSIASGVTGTISVGPNNRTMTAESGAWGPPNRL